MRAPAGGAVLGAALALLLAACGSGGASRQSGGSGRVAVLYAGSLLNLMEHDVGPAFQRADGYAFEGFGAGSAELVAQIKGRIRQGDVFISASPKLNAGLEGQANGGWVRWYIEFAQAPLVIAYNPHSRFASRFRSQPWNRVITDPGIRLGRTDPRLDPKGKLTVEAIRQAISKLRDPALSSALVRAPVFPEEALLGRLETGQLDAGFFYSSEAQEQGLPVVALTPVTLSATYTISVLARAPDAPGAIAFVRFLLGRSGRRLMAQHGLRVLAPKLVGARGAVPVALRRLTGA